MIRFITEDAECIVAEDKVKLRICNTEVWVNDKYIGNNLQEVKYINENEYPINDR